MANKSPVLSLSQAAEKRNNRTIEQLAVETNRKLGEGTIVRASDMIALPKRMSTGSLWFDLALGGGWPANAWSEIISLESAGKTALALNTIAHNMNKDPKFTALWCAAESFDAEYARSIGVDLKRLWVLEENTMEIVYEKTLEFVEERSVDMAVIDAYPSLVTEAEDVAFIGDAQVSPGARLTGKFMRRATKATKRSMVDPHDRPFTGLFINQWRDKVGLVFGDTRTTPGGKGKNYWFAARVELTRTDWIKDEADFAVAQSIKLNVFKNKSAPPRREGVCDFYFADFDGHTCGDFDTAGEVYKLCTGTGVVERRGNTYYWGEQKMATSQRELEARIRSEEDLCASLAQAIRKHELGTPDKVTETVAPRATLAERRARRTRTSAAS
jgi:recombination protein RecA